MDMKTALRGKLTKKESSLLKASFDIIGNIAILEIPPELEKKEKLIAQTLIKLHKNIKTVCKKTSERKGVYRLRGLKVLSGNSTETVHTESGCRFRMDIKKSYFSVRESTERQRISGFVKPKEKILVLFSGIGPYGILIAKNRLDCKVDMVEINPAACKYAEENIKLNKVSDRVKNCCGDAKKILPTLGMENIGIKSSWRMPEILNRLKSGAKIIEFYLGKGDLENDFENIRKTISFLQKLGIRVMVHQPVSYNGKEVILGCEKDFSTINAAVKGLLELIKGFDNCIGIIMQPFMSMESAKYCSMKGLKNNFNKLKNIYPIFPEKVFPENVFSSNVNSRTAEIEEAVRSLGLKQICFDTAHFINAGYKTKDLSRFIEKMKPKVKIYFHIADSVGKLKNGTDCVNLGRGILNFKKLAPLIDFGIVETVSKDETLGKEILQDYIYLSKLKLKKYNRIVMPLPETAYKFLPLALKHANKGCIIHLYGISEEKNLFSDLVAKIKTEKVKIVGKQKVLPYGPRIWKVRVDLMVK